MGTQIPQNRRASRAETFISLWFPMISPKMGTPTPKTARFAHRNLDFPMICPQMGAQNQQNRRASRAKTFFFTRFYMGFQNPSLPWGGSWRAARAENLHLYKGFIMAFRILVFHGLDSGAPRVQKTSISIMLPKGFQILMLS